MITKFHISDPERDIVEEHSVLEMTEEELHNLIYYAYPSWCRIVKVEDVDYTMDAMHEELHKMQMMVNRKRDYPIICKFCNEELNKND